jgi:hypothetical protein
MSLPNEGPLPIKTHSGSMHGQTPHEGQAAPEGHAPEGQAPHN